EWNYGRSPEFNVQKKNRFSFGQIDARVYVREGMIKSIRLYGDFLGHGEISDIENILTGVKFEKNLIRESLENIEIERYFGDINIEDFADFLTR
ncbi:MAG: lipoate protein ligase C-terminal domain-containing protein, partial [bacterium]